MDREKVMQAIEICIKTGCKNGIPNQLCPYSSEVGCDLNQILEDALALLKGQEELLKHEYWRGYNNGRADERGLQEGTIMQTFSPD